MLSRKVGLKQGKPLARKTPMNRGSKPMARAREAMAPVGQRAKRMRQGKVAPTLEEDRWMSLVAASGCVVCRLQYGAVLPAEVHHLKQGDRRRGHLYTIGLCRAHHQGGASSGLFISRHPWKARFEEAYGTEEFLLAQTRAALLRAGHVIPVLPDLMVPENHGNLTLGNHANDE